jgi:tetratricopeptide (TPR) repeat protein
MAAACLAALASVAVHALFDLPNNSKTALLMLAVVGALSLKIGRRPLAPTRFLSVGNVPRLAILAFVPLVLAGWLWSDRAHSAYDDSLEALAKGEHDAAVRDALEATRRDGDFAAYHLHAGVMQAIAYFVHNNRGDPLPGLLEGGIRSLERGIELEPRGAIGHANLALALQARGERDRAVEEAQIAMERAPNDGTMAIVAGAIFEWAGLQDDAIDAYAWAVTHDPGLIESRFWTTNDFRRGARGEIIGRTFLNDCQKARVVALYNRFPEDGIGPYLDGCRDVVAGSPSDARARSDLAIALQRAGSKEEALREARRAVGQAPDNAFARTALGYVLMDPDTVEEARRELALGADLGDPDAVILLYMLFESSFLTPDEDTPDEVLDLMEATLPVAAPFVYEGGRQQYLLGILYYRIRYYRESPLAILIPSGPDGWLALSSVRAEMLERALEIEGRR